jgi:predicted AAA+ superfamily ATPase
MELLIQRFYEKYAQTNVKSIREFAVTIDWSNRLIGIKGSRGVGKTTLLLQYINVSFGLSYHWEVVKS